MQNHVCLLGEARSRSWEAVKGSPSPSPVPDKGMKPTAKTTNRPRRSEEGPGGGCPWGGCVLADADGREMALEEMSAAGVDLSMIPPWCG